jgi:hypothetical protein
LFVDVLNDIGEDFDFKYDWTNSECNIPEKYYQQKTMSSFNLGLGEIKQDQRILLRQKLFELKCCPSSPMMREKKN